MNLRYKSDCSGIEAASVAWGPLGWEAVAFSEIDKFPAALLAHHYPEVPNVGDFTKDDWTRYKGLDVEPVPVPKGVRRQCGLALAVTPHDTGQAVKALTVAGLVTVITAAAHAAV